MAVETATVHTLYFNNTFDVPTTEMHQIIGVITFFSGLAAVAVDAGVAFVMLHHGVLTNSAFAVLYMNMVFCECLNLTACVFFMAPVIGFDLKWLGDSTFGHKLGHLSMTLWTEVTLITVVISLNRYIAIAKPSEGLFFPTCVLAVVPEWLGLVYSDNLCGQALFAQCAVTCTTSISILIVFNVLTWQAMRQSNKTFESKTQQSVRMTGLGDKTQRHGIPKSSGRLAKENQRRRQVEITYFKQSLLNAICMEGMIISYHGLTVVFQSPLGFYIFGMWPFMMAHGGILKSMSHKTNDGITI